MTSTITYRGEQQVESGHFPVTIKNGQYRIWSGHKLAGQTRSYSEARDRVAELEDHWLKEMQQVLKEISGS